MRRSIRALTLFGLALALFASVPACKGKGGSNAPGGGGGGGGEADQGKQIKEAKSQTLVDLANEDLKKGRYQAARERANKALAENNNNAEAHAVLGAAAWRAGEFEESTKAYKEALEIDKGNFGAVLGYARNLQTQGNHDEAIKLSNELLAKDAKQVDPMMYKFWSLIATSQIDEAIKLADEMFKYVGKDNPLQPILVAQATYVRALEGKGPFMVVEGAKGSSDAQLDLNAGFKHVGAVVGGEFTRALFYEVRDEARIHKDFAAQLKLQPVGKVTPAGMSEELDIVVIPEVKLGDLTIKNVPALVEDLSIYASIGEVPGIVLGRQVMQKLGSVTFDFPKGSSEFTAAAPEAKPAGSFEAPLLLIDMRLLLIPVTRVALDASDFGFYAWFGGVFYKAATAVTRKAYLKSGHLPRDVEGVDDEGAGLKMVYVDKLNVGELSVPGVGGLVMLNTPPNPELGQLVTGTGFEISGYVNPTVLRNLKITYSVPTGKMYLTPLTAG